MDQTQKKSHYARGQVIMGIVVFFLIISSTIVFALAHAVYYQARSAIDFELSQSSYYLAEGLVEDTAYRLIAPLTVSATPTLVLSGNNASASVEGIPNGQEITATANWGGLVRTVRVDLSNSAGASFYYGVQSGNGGVQLNNSSSIKGNLFSSGSVTGSNNMIYGNVISAGPSGFISGIHATSSAYAHKIQSSTIDADAYYQTFAGSTSSVTVSGATCSGSNTHCHPNSADQATTSMPIADSKIAQWESDAAAGGTVTCTNGVYEVASNMSLGPKKIPCDLQVDHGVTLTVNGSIWATGNITFKGATVNVGSSVTGKTIALIADNPSDEINSSTISIQTTTSFAGNGTNSYVMLISMNRSAESSPGTIAINLTQAGQGDLLLYAPHGSINMNQSSNNLGEVTGYLLIFNNSTQVVYKSGLASLLFTSGPSGGYLFGDWREIAQ